MIVEFLGVSGVGKTTIANKYKQQLQCEGNDVIWDTYELYSNYNWLARNAKKFIKVLYLFLTNFKWVKKYYQFLNSDIANKKDLIVPFFNGMFLKALLIKAQNDAQIHIFDEGSFQCLWAIKLRSRKHINEYDIKEFEIMFGRPDRLIVVEADARTIIQRISNRGEYVRILDEPNLLESIIEMQAIQNSILHYTEGLIEIQKINNN